jgi:hypothetical protein
MTGRKYSKEELHQLMCLQRSGAAGKHKDNSGNTRRKRTRADSKRAAIQENRRSFRFLRWLA